MPRIRVIPFALLREPTDWLHLILGIISGFLALAGGLLSLASLGLAVVYIAYQALQEEPELSKVSDFVEFLTGFALGLALSALAGLP